LSKFSLAAGAYAASIGSARIRQREEISMADEGPIASAKGAVELIGEVIKAAADSPHVKEAADNLGQTAVTLTKTINNVLVPLAAINFAIDKARNYFQSKFQQDLAEKAKSIPPEHVIEPKASIAGPALQGLAFTHEEPNLKELYLNLLATSMDGRAATVAHPAFVEIIKQLDSEDARLVQEALRTENLIPIAQIRIIMNGGLRFQVLSNHILNLRNTSKVPIEDPQLPAMIDNWVRLGLVEVSYAEELADGDQYAWLKERPEYLRLQKQASPEAGVVDFKKGIMKRTELGKRFAQAVGLVKQDFRK
jgi:hypothetical protein